MYSTYDEIVIVKLLTDITNTFQSSVFIVPHQAVDCCVQILKQENSQLKNRSELVTQCSTGPQVFINCAGFIRIDTNAFTDTSALTHTLIYMYNMYCIHQIHIRGLEG